MSNRARGLLAVLTALAVVSCGSPASPAPAATPSSSGPSPTFAPALSPGTSVTSLPPSTTPAGSASPTPSATLRPTPPAPTSTTTAAPAATPSSTLPAGFACGYPYQRAATKSGTASATDVRVGAHDEYDRIVFDFQGTGAPEIRMERVTPPFVKDPSGLPLAVTGSSFVWIRMVQASGAGYAQPDGRPTYTGPSSIAPGYLRLVSLVQAGDFEGYFTWIGGLSGPMCYQVTELASPARLVIDLRAP